MTPTPHELNQLAERLREFLTKAGWSPDRQARGMTFFYPPDSLGIQGRFSVALPDNSLKPEVAGLLHGVANSLVEIYGYGSVGDLLDKAAIFSDRSQSTRIVTRFIDGTTRQGGMPLASLAAYVSNIEQGLYRSAKFKLGVETKENKLIAQKFVIGLSLYADRAR